MRETPKTIGIVGSGQLSLFLCHAIRSSGMRSCILSKDNLQPACHAADQVIIASDWDRSAIKQMADVCDVITFESDHIDNELLCELEHARKAEKVNVFPQPHIIFGLKDKGKQKQWLTEQGLPTLPFELVNGTDKSLHRALDSLGCSKVIQKMRIGGYDDKGVQLVDADSAIDKAWREPSLLEPALRNFKELAVIVARDTQGDTVSYPAFDMLFDDRHNAVDVVSYPSSVSTDIAGKAQDIARTTIQKLQGVGVFAVEFFLTDDNQLFINEISPRVHNSGHLTMEACEVSQFLQHISCISGNGARDPGIVEPATMLNLLYEPAMEEACPSEPVRTATQDRQLHVHWYGKTTGQYGRKMGHITAIGHSASYEAAMLRATLVGKPTSQGQAA